MKRYALTTFGMTEDPKGEWCKADDPREIGRVVTAQIVNDRLCIVIEAADNPVPLALGNEEDLLANLDTLTERLETALFPDTLTGSKLVDVIVAIERGHFRQVPPALVVTLRSAYNAGSFDPLPSIIKAKLSQLLEYLK